MEANILVELFRALGFLSIFWLIGNFMTIKINFIKKLFLPASVIGGFLALILGPKVLNVIAISENWLSLYSILPGILIVPIVASIPLGINFKQKNFKTGKNTVVIFFLFNIVVAFQNIIGFSTNLFFEKLGIDLYRSFGWELAIGFSGGHGTAGVLGNTLRSLNLPFWEVAQGVAVTTATFGIVGGILLGMVFINLATKKGLLSIKKSNDQNLYNDFKKKTDQSSKNTGPFSNSDSLTFHFTLIITASGIAYYVLDKIKLYQLPVLSDISIWAYAILVMFVIWWLMQKFKLDYLVDYKTKSKITAFLTEIAITAAIISIPLKGVFKHLIPILLMVFTAFIFTYLSIYYISKKYFDSNHFINAIAIWGVNTGMFLSGLVLLRSCDPEFKTPVLTNFSLAYTAFVIFNFAILQVYLKILLTYGALGMIIFSSILLIFYFTGLILNSKK